MKVQISIDEELLRRADKFSEENFLSRSGLISLSLKQYLDSNQIKGALLDLSRAMRKIADSGSIDEEARGQLEDFERLAQCLVLDK